MRQPHFSNMNTGTTPHAQTDQRLLQRVFSWMFVGLSLTAIIAFGLSLNPNVPKFLAANPVVFYSLIGLELLTVLGLSFLINRINVFFATLGFFFYAALNGVTFTLILSYFQLGTIGTAFGVAAGMFGVCAALGYFTKLDLSKLGTIAIMALIGLIIATIVNIFLANDTMTMIISYVGVIVFAALTAYDVQRIKKMNATAGQYGEESVTKLAIIGALMLYLDFINMFFYLLQIFGNDD